MDSETVPKFSPLARQLFLTSGPILLTVSCGAIAAYSAILLPQLQDPSSTIKIDESQYSWIASITVLPMAVGCILGGCLMDCLGRRNAQLVGAVPAVAGWAIVYLSGDVPVLLLGRFLKGLSAGVLAPPSNVYVGETTHPKYRGFLLAALILALTVGMFACHLMGTFLSWRLTALLNVLFPVVGFLLLLPAPESPSWLTKKGRLEEAERQFVWCRGRSAEARDEMVAMLDRKKRETEVGLARVLKKGSFVRPLAVIVAFLAATQLTGVNAITFYAVDIMRGTVGDGLDEYAAMLIVDGVRMAASCVACVLLRRMGRRPLALISGCGCTVSLFCLGASLALPKLFPSFSAAIPSMTSLMGYMTFVMLGIMPLPWAMVGELFPLNAREIGSGIASCVAFLAMFVVVKSNPVMFETIGASATFLVYGCVALAETVFLMVMLPETKNKTLQEVEDSFRRKKDGVKNVG